MSFISGLFAIAKAVPVVDSWLRALVSAYVKWQIEQGKRDLAEALQKMFEESDQRDLEKEIGSSNAGRPAQNQDGVRTRPNNG